MPLFNETYHILETELLLETDDSKFLGLFRQDYSLFKERPGKALKKLSFSVILNSSYPELRGPGEVVHLKGHPDKRGFAFQFILKKVMVSSDDFFIIHGGVVARGKKAMVFSGPPGVGKTTLVMELLKNGFTFFSDEFCPLNRRTGFGHPFPRTMWKDRAHSGIRRLEKKFPVGPGEFNAPVGESPQKIGAVFCLSPEEPAQGETRLHLGLKKVKSSLIEQLALLPGVRIEPIAGRNSDWSVQYPQSQKLSQRIKSILEEYESDIWNVFLNRRVFPNFSENAVISAYSTHETAFFLLRDLKNIDFPGKKDKNNELKPAAILMELNILLEGVPCYRLSPGRLDSMVERIIEITGPP